MPTEVGKMVCRRWYSRATKAFCHTFDLKCTGSWQMKRISASSCVVELSAIIRRCLYLACIQSCSCCVQVGKRQRALFNRKTSVIANRVDVLESITGKDVICHLVGDIAWQFYKAVASEDARFSTRKRRGVLSVL